MCLAQIATFAMDSPITSLKNITLARIDESLFFFIKCKMWICVLMQFVKVVGFVSLTCSGSWMTQLWVGGGAAGGTAA